MDGKLLNFGFS